MTKTFSESLGNPAPLGLVAFGTTTFYLMTIDMGWSDAGFQDLVAANAFYYGGLCQLIVGIAELIKGSSFSFLVFGSYGAFWMGFSQLHFMTLDTTTDMGNSPDMVGKTMYYLQWTVLTTFFTFVATRKNRGLVLLLGLLATTFGLLTISTGTSIVNPSTGTIIKRIAGYVGFATALQAYYMAFAEIINEEWGKDVLPGLKPLIQAETTSLSLHDPDTFMDKHMTYNVKSNTLFLSFRGLFILSLKDVQFISDTIETMILQSTKSTSSSSSPPQNFVDEVVGAVEEAVSSDVTKKVHVVVDYQNAVIATDVESDYKQAVSALEKKYYLSATRYGVSSFGTNTTNDVSTDLHSLRKLG